jgi:hypothetical protein
MRNTSTLQNTTSLLGTGYEFGPSELGVTNTTSVYTHSTIMVEQGDATYHYLMNSTFNTPTVTALVSMFPFISAVRIA